jgi:hypothetical protein
MKHIQNIIDERLDDIINLISIELGQSQQEPDYVIMKELKRYFCME